MEKENMSGHLAQALQHLCGFWEARQQSALGSSGPTEAFTIALSREGGTQGAAVAQEVGRLLDWRVYDRDLIEQIAQDMGLRTRLLESVDERKQSWLRETVEAFVSAPRKSDWGPLVTESSFVHHLVKTVLALGTHGECVIVGRGATFILPFETTLRVRLVAPLKERIAALGQRAGISESEAARQVRTLDRERIDFVKNHFFKDPADPDNYDLFLNTSRLSVSRCAELIAQAVRGLEIAGREKTTTGSSLLSGIKNL